MYQKKIISNAMLILGHEKNYPCFVVLDFFNENVDKKPYIKSFLCMFSKTLEFKEKKQDIIAFFVSSAEDTWSEIKGYATKEKDEYYFFLRLKVFFLPTRYDLENLSEYHEWLDFFLEKYLDLANI